MLLIQNFQTLVMIYKNLFKQIAIDFYHVFTISFFVSVTCLTASVLTLSAISCDRFVAIWFPLRNRVTKQRTGIIITSIWIISMTVSLPFLIYRKYQRIQVSLFIELE